MSTVAKANARKRAPSSAPAPPVLERAGVRYFRSRSRAVPLSAAGDAVHFLNPEERKGLQKVQRGAIFRACLAGALSTIAAATAEVLADPLLPAEGGSAGWQVYLQYWAIVGGVTVVASVFEILFLYWDSLRSVHELARVAGLELFPPGVKEGPAVAAALARAALELPNPAYQVYGIDPHRETSRLRLLAASIVYKLKVSISNFAVKTLVRRVLGRAAVRTLVPFVAVPLTAAWNGVVTYLVLRESRLRAMGPSAAKELVGLVLEGAELSAEGKRGAVRAVASAIVRTKDLHPNLLAVLQEVWARCGQPADELVDDSETFLKMLPQLAVSERKIAVRLLAIAVIIDGKLSGAENRLLTSAFQAAELPAEVRPVEDLRQAFVNGEALGDGLLDRIG